MRHSIYVVEDDPALQELYTYALEKDFSCCCFEDSASFFSGVADSTPDLVLLDIMLPGEDGFAILQRLKSDVHTSRIPVIMVSAKGDEASKVRGLNMGADDYVAKPFGVLELIARINANLRRITESLSETVTYRDIMIDDTRHKVTAKGNEVPLTLKEYNLLCLLCHHAGRVLDRERIFTEVWGSNFLGESRTLDIHIKELRRKLTEAGCEASIQTVRGVGYMLL